MDYEQAHFITFTKVGRDVGTWDKTAGTFDATKKDGIVSDNRLEERNPAFSTALDPVGRRIRKTEGLNMEWFVALRLAY